MKKVLFLLILFSCSKNDSVDNLYDKYQKELLSGNLKNAEKYLDDIIKIEPNNSKFLNLKIPILINNCKKEEALTLINKSLKTTPNDINLLLFKALLLQEGNDKKQSLESVNNILKQKIKTDKNSSTIVNYIVVNKLLNIDPNEIKTSIDYSKLSENQKNIVDNYTKLSSEELTNNIVNCK